MTDYPPPPPPSDRIGPRPPWYEAATPQAVEHPDGTTVLVLGILSLAVCGLLGPFAWHRGSAVLREMDAQPERHWSNRGNVTAGRICGIISSAFLAVGVLLVVLWLLFAVVLFSNIGS